MTRTDPFDGAAQAMISMGQVRNAALAAALRGYHFARPVAVMMGKAERYNPHVGLIPLPSTVGEQLTHVGHAEYIPPPDVRGSDSIPPEFTLDFRAMDLSASLPEVPAGCDTLILQGEMLVQSALGVDVPIQKTIRISDFHARIGMRHPGEWCVHVNSIPTVSQVGRVTFWKWLTAAWDALAGWGTCYTGDLLWRWKE